MPNGRWTPARTWACSLLTIFPTASAPKRKLNAPHPRQLRGRRAWSGFLSASSVMASAVAGSGSALRVYTAIGEGCALEALGVG
jgi:hypothetical protein